MVQPLPAGSRATWQADHQINDLLTDENLDMVERLRGASKPGQLENNLKASGFQIPADAMAEIDRITGFHRFERHVG